MRYRAGLTLSAVTIPVATVIVLLSGHRPAIAAQTCTADDFAIVMDQTGAKLSALSAKNTRAIREKAKRLNVGKSAPPASADGLPLSRGVRASVSRLNARIDDLLSRMDRLGDLSTGTAADCQRLDELKTTASALLDVLHQRYKLIDKDLTAQFAPPKRPGRKQVATGPSAKPARPPARSQPKPQPWTTTTTINADPANGPPDQLAANLPPVPRQPARGNDTFSIAEIRDAGHGFFGTISTSLANVINYTFQKVGRPTGYILGREGGGAFIAGLRYGKGRLIMKRYGAQKVYWRGPSLGYDAGAEGSRTMFLIYNLSKPAQLFNRFSGGDGAAYLFGGVGITFLTNGNIVLAPIRSGIGLRLGASVGYLKFSSRPGWNPF